ncbi:MAG: hypothetical protein ABIO55_10345 [Ginsengibacter sp.]
MTTKIIEYYDYILLLPYIVIFFLLARNFAKKHAETPNEVYWLLINWWIRMVAGLLYAWMIVYYYKYGDPFGYKERSDALFDSILKDWENIKYIFLPAESFKDYLFNLGYSNQTYYSDLGYYSEANFMVSRVSCVAAFFTFNRFLIISFVFTNIAYYGFVLIYATTKKIITGFNKALAIGCMFVPSCVFWSSGLAKEAICMISLGIIFNCSVVLFFQKKIRFGIIFKLIFFSYILSTVKNYIFYCFLVAFIVWIFYDRVKRIMSKSRFNKVAVILLFTLAVPGIYWLWGNTISAGINSNIGEIISSNIDIYESAAHSFGTGSLIDVKDIDVSSIGGILKFIPQGLVNVFFRPFPWEITNVLMIFTVLENLFFVFLFTRVLIKSRFLTRKLFINKNYQVFAIVVSITLAFVIGISTFNFGTMVRYKIPFLPFWASFLLVINKKSSDNKGVVNL